MSASEIFSLEQKPKRPIDEFKEKLGLELLSPIVLKEIIQEFEKLEPSDPKLYEKLRELSIWFPKLPEWFWVMCGSKHEAKNIEEIKRTMNI